MNARATLLLQYLITAQTPTKADILAGLANVTTRTIRNDIKEMHEFLGPRGAEIDSVKGEGYTLNILNEERFEEWMHGKDTGLSQSPIPSNASERATYIIFKLLTSQQGFVKLDELSNDLYVSRSTAQGDLKIVKAKLQKYKIEVYNKPNYGLGIIGDESYVRFCLYDYDYAKDLFTEAEFNQVKSLLLTKMRTHKVFFSDRGLEQLGHHLLIALKRIQEGHSVLQRFDQTDLLFDESSKEVLVAKDVIQEYKMMGIDIPANELDYFIMLFLSTELLPDLNKLKVQEQDRNDIDFSPYAQEVLHEIDQKMDLGISEDKDLQHSLGLHLKLTYNRSLLNINVPNPMIDQIKLTMPVAFEAAIIGIVFIQNKLAITISEHEIGFIALHIEAALERQKKRASSLTKKCIIVCSSGLGSAKLLYQKLRNMFGGKIKIEGTYGLYNLEEAPLENIDFIVSTVPLTMPLDLPVVIVSPVLFEKDKEEIKAMYTSLNSPKLDLIQREFTFLKKKFTTQDEVLEYLCDQLRIMDVVGENFLNLVQERETISPTSYGNLTAIPHPVMPQTEETFWTICTLDKPVLWGEAYVQFVCLLCVAKNEKRDLTGMYDSLIHVIENQDVVHRLINANSFQEIVNTFFRNQKENN
ncbi:BglG family transcription antiterminator [Aureibacillus halotolerans]|uniref:Lichenan operon transcriptional antiterminator n=1 Tax=Aureibacillus halotolerans TaxID=1508390 RepID=A0A4R6U031_9BACI|nr:BglG family transcription antiterminator [Aureibacillus halotolerans]TDQ37689.1 lichenan operon transcriptional antiterminator [Aureibacillus halotolerans]